MALADELKAEVVATFRDQWTAGTAQEVPAPEALRLNANHAKVLEEATVLYADLDGSTKMVDSLGWMQSAEVYKTYLRCASQIIRAENGVITAYDGDRVMAVYTGNSKNTSAVRTAMKINHAVLQIIRPAFAAQYSDSSFVLKHVIGIDTGTLRAARIGVHGDNDIVWVGPAANYAAKMCAFSKHAIWISAAVHDNMHTSVKLANGVSMWTAYPWKDMNNSNIFGSDYYWTKL